MTSGKTDHHSAYVIALVDGVMASSQVMLGKAYVLLRQHAI
jgi:hypothetical protein